MTKSSYFFLFIVFLLVQCTIQKRHYNNGYYIEWKHAIHNQGKNSSSEVNAKETDSTFDLAETVLNENVTEETGFDEVVKSSDFLDDETFVDAPLFKDKSLQTPLIDTVYVTKQGPKYEPVGVAAVVTLIGSFVVAFAPFTSGNLLVGGVVLIVAFALAIISMIRYGWYKDYYQSNLFGLVAFVICTAALILSVFILLVLLALV